MTYTLTAEETAAVLAQDAEQRYHHFLTQAATHGEIWVLKDDDGCISLESDGETFIPVWPHPDYAKLWAGNNFPGCEPFAVTLKVWNDRWVPGMSDDGVSVAVFPLSDADGVVEAPETVADDLAHKQAKLGRRK